MLSLSFYWISLLVPHAHTALVGSDTWATVSKNASTMFELTPPIQYTSDGINVTKCYCESPEAGAAEVEWGHYFKVDYINVHLGRIYSLSWSCSSPYLSNDRVPVCWDTNHEEGQDQDFSDGNWFAYKVGPDRDSFLGGVWGNGNSDYYYFNKQKRGLPKKGPINVDPLPEVCVEGCKVLSKGMVVATDAAGSKSKYSRTWRGQGGHPVLIQSRMTSYPDADDMCNGCK